MRRLVRLAFLAPCIVEAIVEGRQPVELTADRITAREDVPYDWKKQGTVLGFDPAVATHPTPTGALEMELIT